MTLAEFAMVEELAFLIKDNLPCKHLVLSMEETLVDFLQYDTSLDGVLELEPMNPYNRLLLHRLAEIFGFSHQSTGEGDDRHLILKRCQESSIPSILVGDLLWDYEECQSLTSSQLLSRREEASTELKAERPIAPISLEEREAAYLAARERIFSVDKEEMKGNVKEKPRHNPVVARRMIAHALGHRIKQSDQLVCLKDSTGYGVSRDEIDSPEKEDVRKKSLETCRELNKPLHGRPNGADINGRELLGAERKKAQHTATESIPKVGVSGVRKHSINAHKDKNIKEEHIGAAKRMFAHALGIHSTRGTIMSKSSQLKHANKGSFE